MVNCDLHLGRDLKRCQRKAHWRVYLIDWQGMLDVRVNRCAQHKRTKHSGYRTGSMESM